MGHEHPSTAVPRQVQRIQRFRFAIIRLQQVQVGVPFVPDDLQTSFGQHADVRSQTTFVLPVFESIFRCVVLASVMHLSLFRSQVRFVSFLRRSYSFDFVRLSPFLLSFYFPRFLPSTCLFSLTFPHVKHRTGMIMVRAGYHHVHRRRLLKTGRHTCALSHPTGADTPFLLPWQTRMYPIRDRTATPHGAVTPRLDPRPKRKGGDIERREFLLWKGWR